MSTYQKKNDDALSEVVSLLEGVLADRSFLAILELDVDVEAREALIMGNRLGLVKMARLVVKLALDGVDGSDFHFDSYSNLEKATGALVIQKLADEGRQSS
jgi:hypothetical protein